MTAQPLDLDAIRARANEAKAAADVTRFAGQADLVVHGLRAAASVADVPALLAEVERLRDERDKLAATVAAIPDAHHAANLAHARAERDKLRRGFATMREVARSNRRHVATLAVLLERVEQAEPKMHLRQDGNCWPDCPGCLVRAALNTSVTAPVPGSSPRAPEARSLDDIYATGTPESDALVAETRALLASRRAPGAR